MGRQAWRNETNGEVGAGGANAVESYRVFLSFRWASSWGFPKVSMNSMAFLRFSSLKNGDFF